MRSGSPRGGPASKLPECQGLERQPGRDLSLIVAMDRYILDAVSRLRVDHGLQEIVQNRALPRLSAIQPTAALRRVFAL